MVRQPQLSIVINSTAQEGQLERRKGFMFALHRQLSGKGLGRRRTLSVQGGTKAVSGKQRCLGPLLKRKPVGDCGCVAPESGSLLLRNRSVSRNQQFTKNKSGFRSAPVSLPTVEAVCVSHYCRSTALATQDILGKNLLGLGTGEGLAGLPSAALGPYAHLTWASLEQTATSFTSRQPPLGGLLPSTHYGCSGFPCSRVRQKPGEKRSDVPCSVSFLTGPRGAAKFSKANAPGLPLILTQASLILPCHETKHQHGM